MLSTSRNLPRLGSWEAPHLNAREFRARGVAGRIVIPRHVHRYIRFDELGARARSSRGSPRARRRGRDLTLPEIPASSETPRAARAPASDETPAALPEPPASDETPAVLPEPPASDDACCAAEPPASDASRRARADRCIAAGRRTTRAHASRRGARRADGRAAPLRARALGSRPTRSRCTASTCGRGRGCARQRRAEAIPKH